MKISVLGMGSFGTALSNILANNNHEVILWGLSEDDCYDINNNHCNSKFFKDVKLNESIFATTNIEYIKDSDMILFAVPSIAIEDVCNTIKPYITKKFIAINVAKGFHPVSHKHLSVVIQETLENTLLESVVSLIGPSHAEEVVAGLITTVNAVGYDNDSCIAVQTTFSNDYFRVYRNNDVIGAEIGVALKNIMALASGILAGLGQGDNAKAALMTRGLNEIVKYGTYFGGKLETYLGLTGLGDLIVTCTSEHSRNYQAGVQIGKANSSKEFLLNNSKTVEGIICTKIVYEVALEHNISMPITTEMYKVLFEGKLPSLCIKELMNRGLKEEYYEKN